MTHTVAVARSSVCLLGFDPLTTDVLARALSGEGIEVLSSVDTPSLAGRGDDGCLAVVALSLTTSVEVEAPRGRWLGVRSVPMAALTQRALGAGAVGVVDRSAGLAALVTAIRDVTAGRRPRRPEPAVAPLAALTDRELTVLQLLVDGATNEEVAAALGISPNTARTHVRNVLAKLGVRNRLAAASVGRSAGLDRLDAV